MSSDAQLVADYLNRGGTITVCPPNTYSLWPDAVGNWKQQVASRVAVNVRAKKFEDAAAKKAGGSVSRAISTEDIVARVRGGQELSQIAADCGLSRNAIANRLHRHGLSVSKITRSKE